MIILHVTDLHLNERWLKWLVDFAPRHDLLCITGDLLDHDSPVPNARQIGRVREWLAEFAQPLSLCSGNHDLEWEPKHERWRRIDWMRGCDGTARWADGDVFDCGETRFHCVSFTSFPKGAAADVWLAHVPPISVPVAMEATGRDRGDPELERAIALHRPAVVLCGHVHEPVTWFAKADGVIYLNPGHTRGARFPNHVLFDTEALTARRVTDSPIGARCEIARWQNSRRHERRRDFMEMRARLPFSPLRRRRSAPMNVLRQPDSATHHLNTLTH